MNQVSTQRRRILSLCIFTFLLFSLTLSESVAQAPANDECVNAIPITLNAGWVASTNVGTVNDGPNLNCGGGTMIKDVWYSFVFTGGNVSIITQLGTLNDTRIGVRSSCTGAVIACNDDFSGIGLASRINLSCPALTVGETYLIQAGGFQAGTGTFSIRVDATGIPGCTNPTASNYDPCATSNNGSCTYDPIDGSFSYAPLVDCGAFGLLLTSTSLGNISSYSWSMPGGTPATSSSANPQVIYPSAGIYNVSLTVTDPLGAQSTYAQNIAVSASLEFEVEIVQDNYPNENTWKLFDEEGVELFAGGVEGGTFCIDAGQCHSFVMYDSYGDGMCCEFGEGSYTLYIDGVEVGSGSQFGTSETTNVNCPEGSVCNSTVAAVLGNNIAPFSESWFSFTPDTSGQFMISTCGLGSCNTTIWMYDYCNMANFDDSNAATLTYSDDFCGVQAQVTPALQSGTEYFIRIRWDEDPLTPCAKSFLLDFLGPFSGCMNPLACNFDPIAEVDGPCYFNDDEECDGLGPDLRIREDQMFNSMYITSINATDQCLVDEGCVQGFGNRQLVRFTTWIDNIGTQDYYIGSPSQGTGQFEWDPCHQHYHYEGYAEYVLFDGNGFEMPQIGFKNGFCVLDLTCPNGGSAKYTCGNMGITAGCADYYSSGLQCQWVDITDVPAGSYTLVTRVNWDQAPDANGRYELRHDNNWASVCISFDRDANNNILNFTKTLDCPVPIDCLGQPFGSSIPDCLGNCPGVVSTGDLDDDGDITQGDVMLYLSGILDESIPVNTCNDINLDGNITIADAALLSDCVHMGSDHSEEEGTHDHCLFGVNILNPAHTVTLTPAAINTEAGYFDVLVLNPDCKVSAYEFEITGATVTGVASIVSGVTFDVMHMSSSTKVVGLSQHFFLPKNYSPTPLLRVFYSALTDTEICINPIVDVLNESFYRVNTIAGPCLTVATEAFADFGADETTVCHGSIVQFTDLSANDPTSWSWSFSGGSPSFSNSQNPQVIYLTPGTYAVSLTVSNGIESDTKTVENYITVLASGPNCVDCAGILGGTAYYDECDICVGGNTGLEPCPSCSMEGGVLATASPRLNLCIGDNVSNVVQLTVSGNVGSGRFGLVRQSDQQIIATNATGTFNMENYPAVTYVAGHISVPDLSALQGITNVNQLSGCYDLSNFILITTMGLNGGNITANNGTTACGNDGVPSNLSFAMSGAQGPSYRWAVLTQNFAGVIASNTTGIFDFDSFGPGTYKVVRAVYSGINPANIDPLNLPPCVVLSNIITVNISSCAPGMWVDPNPTSGLSNVSFVANDRMHHTLSVYDMQGRMLSTLMNEVAMPGQDYRFAFDGSHLPNGVYIYRLTTENDVKIEKFVIAK